MRCASMPPAPEPPRSQDPPRLDFDAVPLPRGKNQEVEFCPAGALAAPLQRAPLSPRQGPGRSSETPRSGPPNARKSQRRGERFERLGGKDPRPHLAEAPQSLALRKGAPSKKGARSE